MPLELDTWLRDEARFQRESHRHLTLVETRDLPGGVPGWRLWCMNCGLTGSHIFLAANLPDALRRAAVLREAVGPACQHQMRPGDPR